ncbi:small ribosomal subunit protein mS37 [Hetaerina americana]|uniref:small ribosomal subunit protein mS37 n=1 Tax=Hetaerina americana TaxID=62018 RepID=UPI003A7F1F13
MRLSPRLTGISSRYPRENFPFQELLPLKLKPTVSGKGDRTSDVACLQEMAILFACFKKNEFNQALCANEVQTFNKCYKSFVDAKQKKKEMERKGDLNPGAKKLTHKQINQLMKRFPT